MKKVCIYVFLLNSILVSSCFLSYHLDLIKGLDFSSYLLISGVVFLILSVFTFTGNTTMPTGNDFQSEYFVQHDLNTYKVEEENMIREAWRSYFNEGTLFMLLTMASSVLFFIAYLLLVNNDY